MNYKMKALLVGATAGALLGVVFAWIASNSESNERGEPAGLAALGPGDYLQLGISILTLGRQFSSMVKKQ
jgi:hypothetical protein